MGLNFREKFQNMIFAFFISQIRKVAIKENNYTVACDIHNYIFTEVNFLKKFVKILCHKNSDYTLLRI